jgi:hypothetical protein
MPTFNSIRQEPAEPSPQTSTLRNEAKYARITSVPVQVQAANIVFGQTVLSQPNEKRGRGVACKMLEPGFWLLQFQYISWMAPLVS